MRTLFLALAQDVFAILEALPTNTKGQQPNGKSLGQPCLVVEEASSPWLRPIRQDT